MLSAAKGGIEKEEAADTEEEDDGERGEEDSNEDTEDAGACEECEADRISVRM